MVGRHDFRSGGIAGQPQPNSRPEPVARQSITHRFLRPAGTHLGAFMEPTWLRARRGLLSKARLSGGLWPWPAAGLTPSVSSDRKSTRLNSSHLGISYAVFCL